MSDERGEPWAVLLWGCLCGVALAGVVLSQFDYLNPPCEHTDDLVPFHMDLDLPSSVRYSEKKGVVR